MPETPLRSRQASISWNAESGEYSQTDKQMTDPEALHTTARRYLREEMDYTPRSMSWHWRTNGDGDRRVITTYHRSSVSAAIEEEVDSIDPRDYRSIEELRAALVRIGRTADDPYLRSVIDARELEGISGDRARFCEYISGVSPVELRLVEPLPYRRLLSQKESMGRWRKLDERWGTSFGSYWYPLRSEPTPPGVLALQEAWFWHEIPPARLAAILAGHGVKQFWQLSGDFRYYIQGEYEVGLESLEAGRGPGPAVEAYWTSGRMDWLVYISHESSVTVAGDWFIKAVKEAWPGWERHLYTGWDYERPAQPSTS